MQRTECEKNLIKQFKLRKAYAYFEGAWETCKIKKCRIRKTCTGGHRGTCRKSGGIPFCKIGDDKLPVTAL